MELEGVQALTHGLTGLGGVGTWILIQKAFPGLLQGKNGNSHDFKCLKDEMGKNRKVLYEIREAVTAHADMDKELAHVIREMNSIVIILKDRASRSGRIEGF